MQVHGSCHCGAIAYEAEVDPAKVGGGKDVSLLRLSLQVEAGTPADVAIGGLRPPLFWRTRDTTAAALQRWRSRDIAAALEALQGAELRCRQRGMPAETVCRRVLAALQPRRDAGRAGRSPGVR